MLYANNLQDPLINYMHYIFLSSCMSSTYDHRVWKTGLPVRSAVLKPHCCMFLLFAIFVLFIGL
ncbi:unnamed protein product [Penicillium roqueforti FM164]|uniref:Genomic scaffold, ProqFM164S02 n=1 Tax=Penicillium roqueforti (strain FM164) TaxID=1365484 RepID=W6Q801_PENRF|nr:unnamed protein product [Penicillium roqueforti FM164]